MEGRVVRLDHALGPTDRDDVAISRRRDRYVFKALGSARRLEERHGILLWTRVGPLEIDPIQNLKSDYPPKFNIAQARVHE